MRVVSVLPSATEIVCAIGHRADLVGRSAECDYPSSVASLPVVMQPRTFDADRPSREIDARVQSVRREGESLYTLDVALLRHLRPDVLLTQDLCGVCSVTGPEVEAACESAGVRPTIVSLVPRRLTEVWESVEAVGRAVEDPDSGARVAGRLRDCASESGPSDLGPRVAVVEWLDPPILAGLWVPDIVRAGGARPVGPAPGAPGIRTSWAALAADPPEHLILSPCSFSVGRTMRELEQPELARAIRSVPTKSAPLVADEAFFSRPGPRLAEGIALVRSLRTGSLGELTLPVRRWNGATSGATA